MARPGRRSAVLLSAVCALAWVGCGQAGALDKLAKLDKFDLADYLADDFNLSSLGAKVHAAVDKAEAAVQGTKEALLNVKADPKAALAAATAAWPFGEKGAKKGAFGAWKGRNVVLFLTDQETPLLNVPAGWVEANLPGESRLRATGVEFRRSYTTACMCTSARASLFTGLFNPQHNARFVLETTMPDSLYPQVETPDDVLNMAGAAAAAGYEVVYKGKMHLTKPTGPGFTWTPADATKYGFTRWNYPDAGANQSLSESGGMPAENDKRFMEFEGSVEAGEEGALQFLRRRAASPDPRPFFLVVSLVNPHDVLFYPLQFEASGYSPELLEGEVMLPPTVNEDLSTKPSVQSQWVNFSLASGTAPANLTQALAYLNFYANLIKQTDARLVQLLDQMDELGLTEEAVVIKTSDHGEMAMTHDKQIQKMFNFYEPSVRVPLIFSNPVLYPAPVKSQALVSHVDLVPTLATLLGTPPAVAAVAGWQGTSYADAVLDPASHPASPQDYVAFTFDDFQYGQSVYPGFPAPQSHLVGIIEARWKFAQYFDPKGVAPSEYEMYDLLTDPTEVDNLAWPGKVLTREQAAQRKRLAAKLEAVIATRLAPRLGVEVRLDITSSTLEVLARTQRSLSVGGGVSGPPIGGAPVAQPGSTAQVEVTPIKGGACLGNATAGTPCAAELAWSVASGAGTMRGGAVAACVADGGGGLDCKGLASVTAGGAAFRGVRAEGLHFQVTCPPGNGTDGTLALRGVAITASKEAE